MQLDKEVLGELSKPFPANKISIKVQTKPNDKGNSLCVAYIDARDVMDRLDSVVGGEWSDVYTKAPSGGLECALTVCGVTRRDVGDDQNENETEKAGYSDAFKRAAVKFGIGRFLYDLPKMYAQVKQIGKNYYLADGEEARLQSVLAAALNGKPSQKKELTEAEKKQYMMNTYSELFGRAKAVRLTIPSISADMSIDAMKAQYAEQKKFVEQAEKQAKESE